jgi:hypothetical protein
MALYRRAGDTPRPYIGVTGLKTAAEVAGLAGACEEAGLLRPGAGHVPMFGFLCSDKRLADPEKGGRQSPAVRDLPLLTRYTPNGAIPMIHYHTPNKDGLSGEIRKLFEGPLYEGCQAVQLNQDWPKHGELERILGAFKEIAIVLQVPQRAMEGRTRQEVVSLARSYTGLVDYVLIDPSGGKGAEFGLDEGAGLLGALAKHLWPTRTAGIAGGFSGGNVRERVMQLTARTGRKDYCIDAQGRLRTPDREALDLAKARQYLVQAADAFRA